MATTPTGQIAMVVHGTEPAIGTAQTLGMERKPAIHKASVGAGKIWFGKVTYAPNQKGSPHHHGEAETAADIMVNLFPH